MDGWTDGQTDGWTDGRTDGWIDGWMDGWMDVPCGLLLFNSHFFQTMKAKEAKPLPRIIIRSE